MVKNFFSVLKNFSGAVRKGSGNIFGDMKNFLKSQWILCGELKIVLENWKIFGDPKNFLGTNGFFGEGKICFGEPQYFSWEPKEFWDCLKMFLES